MLKYKLIFINLLTTKEQEAFIEDVSSITAREYDGYPFARIMLHDGTEIDCERLEVRAY